MKISDELFNLIKSLSGSEKRYFKLQAKAQGGEKKYLLLFDAIEAQDRYDEDVLRERFRDERFIRQLNVAKRYLYDQILRSLRINHTDSGARAQVLELLKNVEILYEKGLLPQARKMYEKAERIARMHEQTTLLIDMSAWASRLDPGPERSDEEIDRVYDEVIANLDRYRDDIRFVKAFLKISRSVIPALPRTPADLELLEQRASALAGAEPGSFIARHLYLRAQATYHFGRGDYRTASAYTQSGIEHLEANPHMIAEHATDYLALYGNQLTLLLGLDDREGFLSVMARMKMAGEHLAEGAGLSESRIRAEVFAMVSGFELRGLLHMASAGDASVLERMRALVNEMGAALPAHVAYIVPHLTLRLHYNLCVAAFRLHDYRRSLRHAGMILDDAEISRGTQMSDHVRLIQLALHFELGDRDGLEHLVLSTYRYFRSRNSIRSFERIVLDFFLRLSKLRDPAEQRAAFIGLRSRLIELRQDPAERHVFHMFGYLEWAGERIGREGIAEPAPYGMNNTRPSAGRRPG